jgi:uncharacterized membrane protein
MGARRILQRSGDRHGCSGSLGGTCGRPPAATLKLAAGQRIEAIDVLRGLVIVLMALDHIRDYLHISGYGMNPLDPAQTTPLLYTTRWVTNFCAPTFVFLSGVSARLQIKRGMSRGQLAWRLFTRGLWLVVLELTVISFAWAWSMPYMIFLQVIWAIGVSMMLLAAFVFLPRAVVLVVGAAIIVGHGLLGGVDPGSLGPFATVWRICFQLYLQPDWLFESYPLIPWFGIMAFGYGLGSVFVSDQRDRTLFLLGAAMVVLFLVLRGFNLYGDPRPWTLQAEAGATIMVFLDVLKYPPSLLFVLATLGPMLLFFPLLARLPRAIAGFLRTYGAVPLMAYVAHVYVVHLLGILGRLAFGQDPSGMQNAIHNFVFAREAMSGTSLPLWSVYVAWVIVLAAIYPLCRWFAGVKHRRRDPWLSYL